MDHYSYSKEENVTYALDNYLENLALFKGKYIFIDEITMIQEKGFKKELIKKIEKEKIKAFVTSQIKYFTFKDSENIIFVNLGGK